jgi:hypothetical protein
MLEGGAQSNWAKKPEDLQMGKIAGTIDASAYLIVLEGARCPSASESLEAIPKIGRLFSSTRVFREQTAYELLRPAVQIARFCHSTGKRNGKPRTSLERKADAFDEQGMVSFFASRPRKLPQETARSLLLDMRQFIVDLRVEMPNRSIREIAEMCDTRLKLRPSHHSIKAVLASGPPLSLQMRRFPPENSTPDPAPRRHNMVRLHAEGWKVSSIIRSSKPA